MSYTPVELRHVRIGRGLFGYDRRAVEQLLLGVADSFEEVWSERGELADELDDLSKQMAELKRREELLTRTLVSAEQVAEEIREHAKREAALILSEAHQEARSVTRGVHSEHARLAAEVRRMEALLRAALGMVEEAGHGAVAEDGSPSEDDAPEGPSFEGHSLEGHGPEPRPERPATWPNREDTREFPRTVRPVQELPRSPEAQTG